MLLNSFWSHLLRTKTACTLNANSIARHLVKLVCILTRIMHVIISYLRDGNRQVAHQERQKYCKHHLGYPPLVSPRLSFSVVLDCGPLVGCAIVEGPWTGVL